MTDVCFVFRKVKEPQWIKTEDQLNENSIVVKGLEPGLTYQFRVVAVDGAFQVTYQFYCSKHFVALKILFFETFIPFSDPE